MVNYLPVPVAHFFILRHSGQSGQGLIIISQKVIPTQQTLWHILRMVRACYQSFVPPFPWARGYTLRLLRHPRPEPTSPSHPPSNRLWWTYYGLVIFLPESSYEASLRATLQHLFFSEFPSHLNRLHIVVCQGSWTARGFYLLASARLRLSSSSLTIIFEAYVTIQSGQSTLPRQHFWRLGMFILESLSFCFLAVYMNNEEGARYSCIVISGGPLTARPQHGIKKKRETPSLPSTQALEQQVTDTCITVTIFCILAACLFNQIRK